MRRSFIAAALLATLVVVPELQAQGQSANPGVSQSQQAKRQNRQRQIICRGAVIPAGWILVDDLRDTTMCGGSNPAVVNSYNVWAIEKFDGAAAGTTITVCASAQTPAGWTLVDVYRDKTVCGHPDDLFATNVKVIRKNPGATR